MAWLGRNRNTQDPMVKASIDYMDDHFPFWLSKVLNIGQPIMDTSVTTAAIQYEKATGDFTFRMNPEFSASLTDEERAFLMSHEAMHVVRNDMRTHADPRYTDKEALNQAMDAIINDTLTNNGLIAPEWAVNGLRDVGFDCEDADLDEVYEAIVQNKEQQQSDGEGDGKGDGDPEQSDDEDNDKSEGEGGGSGEDADDDNEDDDAESGQSDDEQEDGEGDGQTDDGEDADDSDAKDADDGDGEGDEDEQEDDASDGDGDESDADTDPTESDDEGEGGDGGQSDDPDGDEQDGDDGGEGEGDPDSDAAPRPMAGGGHEGWGDQEDIEDAAEQHADPEGIGVAAGDSDAKKYGMPEGDIVTEAELDRIDFDAMLNLVEPELVDGFGMGHPARADWRRPNRRIMGMYPATTLPSRRDDQRKLALASKRMQLVVFIDNSGSISPQDIALFRKLASRLPKARADYLFVASSSYSVEVPTEDVFDESKPFPYVGGRSDVPRRSPNSDKTSDEWRSANAQMHHPGGWRGQGTQGKGLGQYRGYNLNHDCGLNEFDAMNAWIKVALEDGRLRAYPKSVMVISDAESMLTSSSQEEADRWVVFVNRHEGSPGLNRDGYWRPNFGCKIPQANVHRLADFLLNESHVVKKQRV